MIARGQVALVDQDAMQTTMTIKIRMHHGQKGLLENNGGLGAGIGPGCFRAWYFLLRAPTVDRHKPWPCVLKAAEAQKERTIESSSVPTMLMPDEEEEVAMEKAETSSSELCRSLPGSISGSALSMVLEAGYQNTCEIMRPLSKGKSTSQVVIMELR